MGKSNRIRTNRAKAAVKAPVANRSNKQSKGMPSWLMTLIAIAITVVILASVVLSVLVSSGVPNRLRTAMKSENFTINANMMSYYFFTTYQNFATEYSSSLSSFGLDTSKSLKDQTYTENQTWFDFFVEQTKAQTKSMMIYLEEANARGITLTDEEKAEIKASLDSTASAMSAYYYSANAYFSDAYGKGVSKSDVLKAMEYSSLASKAMTAVSEELEAAVTETVITDSYNKDPKKYNVIDYTYYTFKVDYEATAKEALNAADTTDLTTKLADEANKAKALEAYKAAIAKANADAEALVKLDANAMKKEILGLVAAENYDSFYTSAKVADSKGNLTDADLAEIKTGLMAEAVAKALGENPEAGIKIENNAETGTAYGKTASAACIQALQTLQDSMNSKMTSTLSSNVLDKVNFVEDNEFSTWAFEAGRTAGETKIIKEKDAAAEAIPADATYAYVTAYILRTTPRADESLARNMVYATFSAEATATAALEALKDKEGLDKTAFETTMKEKGASGTEDVTDYLEGMMGSDTFDAWLFDADTTAGKYTKTPILVAESTYLVAYYYGEGMPAWKVDVKNTVWNDNFDAYYTDMEAKYTITTKDNAFKSIDA